MLMRVRDLFMQLTHDVLPIAVPLCIVVAAAVTAINYRIGICQQAVGQWDPAKAWFIKVITANNDAALKERAVARMPATHFALQFGAFQAAASFDYMCRYAPAWSRE